MKIMKHPVYKHVVVGLLLFIFYSIIWHLNGFNSTIILILSIMTSYIIQK